MKPETEAHVVAVAAIEIYTTGDVKAMLRDIEEEDRSFGGELLTHKEVLDYVNTHWSTIETVAECIYDNVHDEARKVLRRIQLFKESQRHDAESNQVVK